MVNPQLKLGTIRVLIVDDHPSVRAGLGARIGTQPDMAVCGEAADADEALRLAAAEQPDVVVVDVSLRTGSGLELVRRLATRDRRIRMLVHSMYEESLYGPRCLQAGARGYINKQADPAEVIQAIRAVHAGQIYVSSELSDQLLARSIGRGAVPAGDPVEKLTARELEIFRLIGQGRTANQIARRLCRSVHTIETHRENIKRKLDVSNIAELTRRAVQWVLENG